MLPTSVAEDRNLVLVLVLALPSQQGTLGKSITLLGPLFHHLWLLVPPAQEQKSWEDTACAGLLTASVIISSVVPHWTSGAVQERRCPGPFFEGDLEQSWLHSQLLSPPSALPATHVPAPHREGAPRDQAMASALFSADSQVSCGPPALLSPCRLPLAGALLAVFSQDTGCWSPGPQSSPTPRGPLEPGAAAFSSQHPIGLQSPLSLTAGSGNGTVPGLWGNWVWGSRVISGNGEDRGHGRVPHPGGMGMSEPGSEESQ